MQDIIIGGCPTITRRVRTQKVIIFDSPDGTGKTNIAYALSQALKIPYFKMNTEHQNWRAGKFKEALEFDQTYLIQFLKQTETSVIIDRAYPAEWVYSQVYNRDTNMDLIKAIDQEFFSLGTNIIIPVRENYANTRHDELVEKKMLPKLHDKYMEFREFTKCRTITIYVDSYKENLQSELSVIIPELNFEGFTYQENVTLHRTVKGKYEDKDIKKVLAEMNTDHLKNRKIKK